MFLLHIQKLQCLKVRKKFSSEKVFKFHVFSLRPKKTNYDLLSK